MQFHYIIITPLQIWLVIVPKQDFGTAVKTNNSSCSSLTELIEEI